MTRPARNHPHTRTRKNRDTQSHKDWQLTSNWHRIHWGPARTRAGLADLRMHDLRHSYATWLVHSGADVITVRDLLGHDSIVTTQLYSHTSAKRMRETTERLFGTAPPEETPLEDTDSEETP